MEKLTTFMEIFRGCLLKGSMLLFVLSNISMLVMLIIFAGMLFLAVSFYKSHLTSSKNIADGLAQQVKGLQQQLDYASREEMAASAEARRSAASREKLLTSISHEIRTPMNGILGMAVLLDETDLTAEQRDYLNTIITSGKKLLKSVNEVMATDLLDNSKINGVADGSGSQSVHLRNCIEEVLDTVAAKAADKKVDLLYEIEAGLPVQVAGSNKYLQQVLMNLVENVIACTGESQVYIGVYELHHEEFQKPALAFEVTDKRLSNKNEIVYQLITGNPMKDYQEQDQQGDKGLGLIISRKIVKEMGGEIKTLARIEGAGDNFIFSMPLEGLASTGEQTAVQLEKGLEGQRILIVHDNIMATGILKNQLAAWKFLPVMAFSGKRAAELLSKESFNLVIINMDMTGTDGIELSKSLKTDYPALPLLLLKSLNDERYKEHEEMFGQITVLNKPVKQHELFDKILSTMRQAKNGNMAREISIKNLSADFATQYPLRILLAEDNPVNQKWAVKILGKMGYQPALALNGHEVLDMVGQDNFDLVLMDVQMPEMDGLEATKMIRVCLQKQPVVIAMTANVMHGDRLACMQAGMDDYISKPVELNALVNMLEKWALVIRERKLVY